MITNVRRYKYFFLTSSPYPFFLPLSLLTRNLAHPEKRPRQQIAPGAKKKMSEKIA